MIGDRLQALARHVLRDETCASVVAPAIADLQYESCLGTWPRVRAYAGVWRALLAAAAQEAACDTLILVKAVRLPSVIGPATVTLGSLTMLMVTPIVWTTTRSTLPWHYDAVLIAVMVPHVLTITLPAAALPLAAAYARLERPGAKRAALLLTSVAITLLMAGNHVLKLRLAPLAHELRFAAAHSVRHPTLHGRPLWEVRNVLRPDLDALARRGPAAPAGGVRAVRERHQSLAMLLMGMTFAICGIVWRRQGSVALAGIAVAVFVAHASLMFVFMSVLYVQRVSGYAASLWSPVLLLFLGAWLLALRSSDARA